MRAAARRPRAGAGRARGAVRRRARRSRSGCTPSAATSTLAGRSSDTYQATERYRERFGDHAIVVLVRGPLAAARADREPRPAARARGLPVGQQAAPTRPRRGGARGPCAELARTKPVQVVYGPGTFINSAVGEIQDQLQRAARRQGRRGGAGGGRGARGSRAARASRRRSRTGSRARPSSSSTPQFVRDLLAAQPQVRARRRPDAAARRPGLRLHARVRPRAAARRRRRRASPTCSRRRSRRRSRCGSSPGLSDARARAGDRAGARGGADAGLRAAQRRGLHGHRRAGAGRGPRRTRWPARSRGCCSSRSSSWRRCSRSCSGAGCGWSRSPSRSPRSRSRSG